MMARPNTMKRWLYTLRNELKLFRTAIPIHLVVVLQPTVMFLLMSAILVHPTFNLYVTHPTTDPGQKLVAAMAEIGSPIGSAYIHPILVDKDELKGLQQVITIGMEKGTPTAIQHYGLIDSNMVKNFRNRLTAAALRVWNDTLEDQAILVEEHPWLPQDTPYTLYFGMAMVPMAVALAASVVGGYLTAQEFEFGTILEYRLAPVPASLVVGARLLRLMFLSLVSGGLLMLTLGLVTGGWPASPFTALATLLPMGATAGCLGIIAGLLTKKSIPSFLVGLVTTFVGYLMGSAFGLAAGFSRTYELISRMTPNTHTVELLFPIYFSEGIGTPWISIGYLTALVFGMVALTMVVYQKQVNRQMD
jgi:hypothetical protein